MSRNQDCWLLVVQGNVLIVYTLLIYQRVAPTHGKRERERHNDGVKRVGALAALAHTFLPPAFGVCTCISDHIKTTHRATGEARECRRTTQYSTFPATATICKSHKTHNPKPFWQATGSRQWRRSGCFPRTKGTIKGKCTSKLCYKLANMTSASVPSRGSIGARLTIQRGLLRRPRTRSLE